MARSRQFAPTLLLALAVSIGACSSDARTAPTSGSSSGTAAATGHVTVLAAASLTEAFTDEKAILANEEPTLDVTYSFGGSGALVTQVQQGAPADVIATADQDSMKKLVDAGLVRAPETFATNRLEVLVAPGNPKGINGLSDLARTDVTVVLGDSTVPFGRYAAQALQTAGVTAHPRSLEADVKSAVAKVTSGEADATIVYATDVQAAGSLGQGVEIPAAENVVATYPIAVIKATRSPEAAEAFVGAIARGSGQAALARRGFGKGA